MASVGRLLRPTKPSTLTAAKLIYYLSTRLATASPVSGKNAAGNISQMARASLARRANSRDIFRRIQDVSGSPSRHQFLSSLVPSRSLSFRAPPNPTHLPTLTQQADKPVGCPICGIKLSAKQSLEQHIRIHTGETPWVCAICNAQFKQQSALSESSCPYLLRSLSKRYDECRS